MNKMNKSPLAAAMGIAIISSFSAAGMANADVNPFGMTELSSGYMQVAEMACGANMPGMDKPAKTAEGACAGNASSSSANKATEGKCGDMMDGDKMKKGMEASCGGMMKGKEGACGEMMKGESMKGKEGSCGAAMKMPEGQCASQCGDHMKACPDAKAKEGACGAAMKGCGETMQGCTDMMKTPEGGCAAHAKTPAEVKAPAAVKTPGPVIIRTAPAN